VNANHVIETINNEFYLYNKTGGVVASIAANTFFASVSSDARGDLFDPTTFYDDATNQFFIGIDDVNSGRRSATQTSHYEYAVSTGTDVTSFTSGWTFHSINTKASSTWGDFPHVGYDSDAWVLTTNQFSFKGGSYTELEMNVINKSTFADTQSTQSSSNFTEFPARMHGAGSGTLYLVQENGYENGSSIQVDAVSNYFSASPTITRTNLTVASYGVPSAAVSPGGSNLDAGDTRIDSAAWRNNRLVATQDIGTGGVDGVRWYEFNTSGTATLTQQGTITKAGAYDYYGAIDVDPGGNLGLSYMESSSSEFVSVYAAGQVAGSAANTAFVSTLSKAGVQNFTQFDSGTHRAGDYSAVAIDPSTNNFWIENEYAGANSTSIGDYGTWIQNFSVGGTPSAQIDALLTAVMGSSTTSGSAAVTSQLSAAPSHIDVLFLEAMALSTQSSHHHDFLFF
jgi:hypothetical protein